MPTYQYRCKNCDHEFEVRQRMSDDPLKDCPICGGEVRRVVGSVGIVFKGKGFYVTDHRNGSGRVQTPDKTDKSADSGDKTEKSSDAGDKPAKSKVADKGSGAAKSSASTAAASSAA